MTRFYLSKLTLLVMLLLGFNRSVNAQITYSYTGSVQTYTATPGTFSVVVDMQGAKGGNGNCSGTGGSGGRTQCTIATTPGAVLYIYVGGAGTNYVCCSANNGGFNGGGNGYQYGGGGGGASDIRIGSTALSARVCVAAGGGGGSYNCCNQYGGNGGGLTGANGLACSGYQDGQGGTQTSGGAGGTYSNAGSPGTLGLGGNGYSPSYGAGGGGGGYYGGGGGSYYGSGGGGSSYTNPTVASGVTLTPGYNASGNGVVTITSICTPPVAGSILGNTNICGIGSTSALTSTGSTGGVWTSSNPAVATVGSLTGIVTSVSVGTVTVTNNIVYSCGSASAVKTVTVNPVPAAISGSTVICSATPSTLSDATPAGTWTSSNPAQASVGLTTGLVTGLAVGNPTITYTLNATGCFATKGTTVNISPSLFTVTGGGSYCAGSSGVPVGLNSSTNAIDYQLWRGGTLVTTNPGTGTLLNFGLITTAGSYTVVAVDPASSCQLNMSGSANVVVNPVPVAYTVTGGGSSCAGGIGNAIGLTGSDIGVNYQLYNGAAAVGSPLSGTGLSLNFGTFNVAGTYTVVAVTTATGCTNNMTGSAVIVVNPVPNVYTVSGGGSFCAGGSGLNVCLSGSDAGVNYQLYSGASPVGSPIAGTGVSICFPPMSIAGTYSIVAVNATTGCSSNMSGTATISVNPLPTAYTISGGGSYCTGGSGVHVGLPFSNSGVSYQLYNTGVPVPGGLVVGTGGALDFGAITTPGSYSIVGTNTTTGCTNGMAGAVSVSINPLPSVFSVNGGGNFCAGGAGVAVGLSNSSTGINYQLYNGGSPVGGLVAGTGMPLNFGLQTTLGTYTVLAINSATGCTQYMLGSATVVVDPLPVVYAVTGGGNYCVGGSGVDVALNGSDAGISYQLYYAGSPMGAPLAGTGLPLDFGFKTSSGVYTVVATNTSTGCNINMSGSVTVTINPLPAIFSVTGGGNYCLGTSGVHVGLTFSSIGVNYQLYINGIASDMPAAGTGTVLDFGLKTTPGLYTVIATNATTGCVRNMTGSATVTVSSLPAVYTTTGGGNYCATGTGVPVSLSASNGGIAYQLYNGTMPVGTPVAGSGSVINFGLQTAPGIYTVVATSTVTGCSNNMNGNATVAIDPLPIAHTTTGGGTYCLGGTGVNIGLASSDATISYQLYSGLTPVGSAMIGTGSSLNFGVFTTAGTYTIMGTDGSTGCTSNMSGSALVTVGALPHPYVVTGGGSYCAGGTGNHIGLSGSASGINYQLYNMGSPVGMSLSGTGLTLDFGLQTTGGTYTIIATEAASGCVNNMMSAASITVNPLPNVYTVTGGGAYCAGGAGVNVDISGSDIGTNYMLYNGTMPVAGTYMGIGSPLTFGPQAAAGNYTVVAMIPSTGCTSNMSSSANVSVNPIVVPSLSIASGSTMTVCADTILYLATTANAGSTPHYQWTVNGTIPSDAIDSVGYGYEAVNGDVVTVTMTSSEACATPATATATVTMIVNPLVAPAVTISANTGVTVCPATTVIYSAFPSYGGMLPTYTWYKSGSTSPVGTGLTYTGVPANGEIISCIMTSDYACRTADEATSNSLLMSVVTPVAPTFTITCLTNIVIGQPDTFKAVISANGGPAPTFQWYVNGAPVATGNTFISNTLVNKDSVSCMVTGSGLCGGLPSTKAVVVNVRNNVGVAQVTSAGSDIRVMPNPNKGSFAIKGSLGIADDQELTVEITNMLGQVVYANKILAQNGNVDQHVQLNNIANGMYLLSLRSATENTVVHIVIEQ